jgi:hypothetical protein
MKIKNFFAFLCDIISIKYGGKSLGGPENTTDEHSTLEFQIKKL